MADDETQADADSGARTVQNMPVLDLSGVRDRSQLRQRRIQNVALVLVPEDIPDLLSEVSCENVGAIVPVPAGTRVESRIGQAEVSGATLAAGREDTILLLVGQIVVTPPVPKFGYRGILMIGQILLPKEAEPMLTGRIISQVGQVVFYEGQSARLFLEDVRFTKAFFDLVDGPQTLVLVGDSTWAADVTPQVVRDKVAAIMLIGDATVENADLQPVLQYLAKTNIGEIRLAGGGNS